MTDYVTILRERFYGQGFAYPLSRVGERGPGEGSWSVFYCVGPGTRPGPFFLGKVRGPGCLCDLPSLITQAGNPQVPGPE